MRRSNRSSGRSAGFSLIEVMIAVVVLAVGLLALVALQTNLVRVGADAKARSRIASLVSSHMDEARAGGYTALATVTEVGCTAGNDICQAQTDAAVSNLMVGRTVGTAFGANDSQFKTLRVSARWTDSAGNARALSMDTVISPLSLDGSGTLVNQQLSGDVSKTPVVRTTNPATPGMIPVAVSATDSTAATNPRPERLSKDTNQAATGTKFDVLTYTNETTTTARIQRRVETTVIKCSCQYGAGGTNLPEIYQTARWPAIWTGERYDIFKPETASLQPAGAAALSGPAAGASQSALCMDCCRDHHDPATSTVAKFDPERTIRAGEPVAHSHYGRDAQENLVLVVPGGSGVYEEACRMIRVDGMWRTAADMYNRYSGLLATAIAAGKTDPATTGVPSTAAADSYGGSRDKGINGFVKDVLASYRSNGWRMDLQQATALYDEAGLNNPAELTINRPTATTKDQRYLHLRGLYVDVLNKSALDRIAKALRPENCKTTNTFECILPYIPFTTINLTELAFWQAQVKAVEQPYVDNKDILKVETASPLTFDPLEPYRGRTNALTTSKNDDIAFAVAMITRSNSGVAVMPEGVDPEDDRVWSLETDETLVSKWATDRQRFKVLASGTSVPNDKFWVRLAGLPQTSDKNTDNDPKVTWSVSTQSDNCGGTLSSKQDYDPNDYLCATPPLGITGSVGVSRYYIEDAEAVTQTANCTYLGSTVSVTDSVNRPYFRNFQVASASVNGVAGTVTVVSDGKTAESSTIRFSTIPSAATVTVNFAEQTRITATLASCTASRNRNGSYSFATVTWSKPWEQ